MYFCNLIGITGKLALQVYMESNKIRQAFLDFFAGKGHTIVPSAPMVVKTTRR